MTPFQTHRIVSMTAGTTFKAAGSPPSFGAADPVSATAGADATGSAVALPSGQRGVTIVVIAGPARIAFGDDSVVATAASAHYLAAGERIEVGPSAEQTHVAVWGVGVAATVEISALDK